MSGKRRWLAASLVVAAGTAAFAAWPRPPRLVPISPPIETHVGQVRLKALVPEGWRIEHLLEHRYTHPTDPSQSKQIQEAIEELNAREPYHTFIILSPPERPGRWLPEWLRTTLFGNERARLTLAAEVPSNRSRRPEKNFAHGTVRDGWSASRIVFKEDFTEVTYYRQDRAAFEATYRQICESFRVVR